MKPFPLGLFAIVGSLLAIAPALAEPVRFMQGPALRGGSTFDLLVEPGSIERQNSRVSWVQESVQHDGRGELLYRARAQMVADCQQRDRQLRREMTVLVEAGEAIEPYTLPGDNAHVEAVEPGSAAEQALAFVCEVNSMAQAVER